VKFLSERINSAPRIPDDPQIVSAFGAALIAKENLTRR
jgi:activator of 2-hydroxyglutaryl-CoA dehydratase